MSSNETDQCDCYSNKRDYINITFKSWLWQILMQRYYTQVYSNAKISVNNKRSIRNYCKIGFTGTITMTVTTKHNKYTNIFKKKKKKPKLHNVYQSMFF